MTTEGAIGPEDERQHQPPRPRIDALVDPERWEPLPTWFEPSAKRAGAAVLKRYEDFFRHRLRSRYMELEAMFRGFLGAFRSSPDIDETTAEQIADHLWRARLLLEEEKPDLYMVSDILDLVEQYMVWVTPE